MVRRGALLALVATACGNGSSLDGAHLRAHPDAIDLGFADCGGATPSADWVVENDGVAQLEVTATADPQLVLDETHFFVDAHGSITVHVAGLAAPKDGHAGEITHAAIHVTTNDGSQPFDIDVTATTHGAALELVPPKIDLGLVPVSITSPPHGFALSNTGNADVDVSLSQPNPDFTIGLETSHFAGDQTVQGSATFFASAPGATKTTVAIDAKGVVCGDVPQLEVIANGAEGTFGFSPGSLELGGVYCGHAAKPQTITLLNGGNAPYAFMAKLASGTGFNVSPASGVVKTSLAITVTPLPMPKNAKPNTNDYNDTLTITTNIPDDAPHVIDIHENAAGAAFHFVNPTDSFGKVQVGQDVTHYETLVNDGSNVNVSIASASSGNFTLTSTYGAVNVTFHPDPTLLGQKETATFTLNVSGPTCGDPPTLHVDATHHDTARNIVALDDATCVTSIPGPFPHVYCWGSNASQELGTNTVTSAVTPRWIVDLQNYDGTIDGGGAFAALGLLYGGFMWGTVNGVTTAPTDTGWTYLQNVRASRDVACLASGWIYCFGKGGYLGDGTTNDSATTVLVPHMQQYLDVGEDGHVCATGWDANYTILGLYCWGPDDSGQIGDGNYGAGQRALSPISVPGTDETYTSIAAGNGFTCAFSAYYGQTICFGRNTYGECGTTPSSSPVLTPNVVALTNTVAIDAGRDFVCEQLGPPLGVACWGSNARGQLGDGQAELVSATAVTVPLATTIAGGRTMSAGKQHACAVLSDGRVQCWGSNTYGEIGDGTTNDATSPVFVKGFD